jgi:hypothetical protein
LVTVQDANIGNKPGTSAIGFPLWLQGQIILRCGVYDYKSNGGLGTFLEMTPKEFRKAKENHPTCEKCTRNAIHVYAEYQGNPELAEKYARLVESNLKKQSLRAAAHRVMV